MLIHTLSLEWKQVVCKEERIRNKILNYSQIENNKSVKSYKVSIPSVEQSSSGDDSDTQCSRPQFCLQYSLQ